jgi:glycosyltransferase involved in cell wall biosynthesis
MLGRIAIWPRRQTFDAPLRRSRQQRGRTGAERALAAMISIVIPAHNEASTIARTLATVTTGSRPQELDVVVVCNGCTDKTAEVARRHGGPVRVIETAIANKASALNIGDNAAGPVFPRVYIDADIGISLETVRGLADRLEDGDVLAVAPKGVIDTSTCSRAVRWFFDIASLLPSAKEGIGGSGVYALAREGRQRFNEFPDVIADDAFVRIQFSARECETIQTLTSTVIPPQTLRELIRVRSRVRHGHLEVAQVVPHLWQQHWKSNTTEVFRMFRDILLWPKLIVYAYVVIIARLRGRWRFLNRIRLWDSPHRLA